MILPDEQLEALLDKLSGFVKDGERILILARYHHLRPEVLQKAATRWPKLTIDFMTIHASKGQQADYVIIVGLHEGNDGSQPRRGNLYWKMCCYRLLKISLMLKSGVCFMSR